MVGGYVQQHGRLGGEVDRVLELEGGCLTDDRRGRVDAAGERAERDPDVARDRYRAPASR